MNQLLLVILAALAATPTASPRSELSHHLRRAIERCSITANAAGHPGPVALSIDADEAGRPTYIDVQTAQLQNTDFANCLHEQVRPSRRRTVSTSLFVVPLHPWAGRSRRSWPDVRAHLQRRGFPAAVRRCAKQQKARFYSVELRIALDGTVIPNEQYMWGSRKKERFDEAYAAQRCVADASRRLLFGPSGHEFIVNVQINRLNLSGHVVFPRRCVVQDLPCSVDEENQAAAKLAAGIAERIECEHRGPTIRWLRSHKAVRYANVFGECGIKLHLHGAQNGPYRWSPDTGLIHPDD